MQFKVPQDVQQADRIVWFLTLPQLIICVVGFAMAYGVYSILNQQGLPLIISLPPVILIGMITAAFAFLKIANLPFHRFLALLIERFITPSKRVWVKGADRVTSDKNVLSKEEKAEKKKKNEQEQLLEQKSEKLKSIEELTQKIDTKDVPKPEQPPEELKEVDNTTDEGLLQKAFVDKDSPMPQEENKEVTTAEKIKEISEQPLPEKPEEKNNAPLPNWLKGEAKKEDGEEGDKKEDGERKEEKEDGERKEEKEDNEDKEYKEDGNKKEDGEDGEDKKEYGEDGDKKEREKGGSNEEQPKKRKRKRRRRRNKNKNKNNQSSETTASTQQPSEKNTQQSQQNNAPKPEEETSSTVAKAENTESAPAPLPDWLNADTDTQNIGENNVQKNQNEQNVINKEEPKEKTPVISTEKNPEDSLTKPLVNADNTQNTQTPAATTPDEEGVKVTMVQQEPSAQEPPTVESKNTDSNTPEPQNNPVQTEKSATALPETEQITTPPTQKDDNEKAKTSDEISKEELEKGKTITFSDN